MGRRVQNQSRHVGRWVLLAVLLLLAAFAVFAFLVNRWQITVTPLGDNPAAVEYGEHYTDAGADARFHGTILFPNGWPVRYSTRSGVDTAKIGSYTIDYTAEQFLWHGAASRTVVVRDTQAPIIDLVSDPEHYTLPGQAYEEEGFAAIDNYDGDLTEQVTREEQDGRIIYRVTDSSGNQAEVVREIVYNDPIPPELSLLGEDEMTINAGSTYEEPGWSAVDNVDGDLNEAVQVEGSVDTFSASTYTLIYSVADSYGNTVTAERTVTVQALRQPDVVTPGDKVVYLTFDDGPGKYTQQLLDVLEQYNVKVTFFTCNTKYTSLIAKEVAAGHSVGIHSASHDYAKIYASEEAFFADLQQQSDIIYNEAGIRTTLLRFPGGSSNAISKKYNVGIMTRLVQDVTDMGYQYFDWNVLSGDAGETTDTDVVYQNVIEGIQKHNVSVVLQHDIKGFSVDAVERIIQWGLANGYTFLPLTSSSPTAHHGVNN